MATISDTGQRLKYVFILVAMVIAGASLVFSNMLTKQLAGEEREKMEIFAEAQRSMLKEQNLLETDMSLYLRIVEGNRTIPVILCRADDSILYYKNIDEPEEEPELFLQEKLAVLKTKNPPIAMEVDEETVHYLYYDDSVILKRLSIYPYVQLAVVFIFILISFLALASTKRAEQNRVWVGLSKETAHQLGTPISSLMAWVEYLKMKEIDPSLLAEMQKDVSRLEMVADRFSKIGSRPDPTPVNLVDSVRNAVSYLETRISAKVRITMEMPDHPVRVKINDSLFSWVMENLIKNAVDAMSGQGDILIRMEEGQKEVRIDVTDSGKGIPKSRFKTVFSPGYTTKARGWGLGLSLVKRIVESYHNGKIYVKSSEVGRGTTFRIELPKR
ncbi:two-component system, sporulation sensor kinase D [Parabacteroides sp. PFB2-12]|uniref:sensor histidine kinase n=1 Tax=unclassified Parabacteroides TaxID=2649774 RepID=UPI002476FBE7|nr:MULTISPECIES: HAMP domain-containing sensor histidine kinase [unclassified Parabacteroides]MDH6341790.1 two-component system, sporulation sensor kinase D [Parabacteroides sp. PM6-13]MDH6389787.1 two-component system, sporulation sensor kinase D [Parabacteroides sp. PFB2-12]